MKHLIILLLALWSYCSAFGQKTEYIIVNLPDKENWKITENNFKNKERIILVANDKTSERISLISGLDAKKSDLTKAMNNFYNNSKSLSKDAKLSVLGKDLKTKEPWIMYIIENINNKECNCKEAQICIMIQGENCLHRCIVHVTNALTKHKKDEIIKILKTAKIVSQ